LGAGEEGCRRGGTRHERRGPPLLGLGPRATGRRPGVCLRHTVRRLKRLALHRRMGRALPPPRSMSFVRPTQVQVSPAFRADGWATLIQSLRSSLRAPVTSTDASGRHSGRAGQRRFICWQEATRHARLMHLRAGTSSLLLPSRQPTSHRAAGACVPNETLPAGNNPPLFALKTGQRFG
jgi:hypothetical protein